jgi:hypothetical protein
LGAEGKSFSNGEVVFAPLAAEPFPDSTTLEASGLPLAGNNGGWIKPRRENTVEHVWKHFLPGPIKELGDGGDIQIEPVVVGYLDVLVGKETALYHAIHNVQIVEAFWWLDEGGIETDPAAAILQEGPQALVPPRFKVRSRECRRFEDGYRKAGLPLVPGRINAQSLRD